MYTAVCSHVRIHIFYNYSGANNQTLGIETQIKT